jgi:quercetin dioxygenase-like cupin family protein
MAENDRVEPIALRADEGEAVWAFGGLGVIKASGETTNGALGLIEQLAPQDTGSPLHVHHREDEWFFVIDGELTLWVGGNVIKAPAGSFVYGPREIPHTFVVSSKQARFLLCAQPAGFEKFFRTAGEPAGSLTIPPPQPPPADMAPLVALAGEFGIEILGPPGIPTQ